MAKQVRERTGCWTCRTRKKKCDARLPSCRNCELRGVECRGYGLQLVWEDEYRRAGMKKRGPPKRSKGSPSSDVNAAINRPTLSSLTTSTFTCDLLESAAVKRFWIPLSPFATLSPVRAFLLDHYLHRFSTTYFMCRDPRMPFLSMIIPIAMENSAVLCALVALSGLQVGRQGSLDVKLETLRARDVTIRACRDLARRMNMAKQEAAFDYSVFGGSGRLEDGQPGDRSNQELTRKDMLFLLASALLLLLYEQVTHGTYSTLLPHLKFVQWIIKRMDSTGQPRWERKKDLFSSDQDQPIADGSLQSQYSFLKSIFLYDDLIISTSSRRPPIEGYHYPPSVDSTLLGESENDRYYFPSILSRISSGDESVCVDDIDRWDGSMEWLPSLFVHSPDPDEELLLISEMYRAASKVYYYQHLRSRLQGCGNLYNAISPSSSGRDTDWMGNVDALDTARTRASSLAGRVIDMIRRLPQNSQYEGALLWPIGILAREIDDDLASQSYILWRLEELETKFGMTHFGRFRDYLMKHWKINTVTKYESLFLEKDFSVRMNGIEEEVILG